MKKHTVEKIGGTSMSDYVAVRDNIILQRKSQGYYGRIFVVSAYGGITNLLLEHKKTGAAGVYSAFAESLDSNEWQTRFNEVEAAMLESNCKLFAEDSLGLAQANNFIKERLQQTRHTLISLSDVCKHGHFDLQGHLHTVREMLASLGEAHSAYNLSLLLQKEGVDTRFVDLSGWEQQEHCELDIMIERAFADVDYQNELPIVTGYCHCRDGLMASFDRGYSEMTFSRIAVITQAAEAVIHKEFHLSSADPRIVGVDNAVPIGRTNYDVADQLANLGMEAIHPRAAKGLRQNNIPLRIMNTFDPEHQGTLITCDYVSENPCVEIIASRTSVYALEVFDQDMMGAINHYDQSILQVLQRFRADLVTKDVNANTITHYLASNLKTIKRVEKVLQEQHPECEIRIRRVAVVSAIGSDMKVKGILAKTVAALANSNINVQALHQSMRQVDMQFIVDSDDCELAVKSLHECLIEIHDHGEAICAA